MQNLKLGWRFACYRRACRSKINPLVNTIFEASKIEFASILRLALIFIEGMTVELGS